MTHHPIPDAALDEDIAILGRKGGGKTPIMTRGVPTFGYVWIKAGFRYVGKTKDGKLAFQMLPEDMPHATPALPREALAINERQAA